LNNAALATSLTTGLFKAAVQTTGTNVTAPYLGLIILGTTPGQPQTTVSVQVALLVAPLSGGAANTAEANRLAGLIDTQLLGASSPILTANLAAAKVAFAAASAPFTSAAGTGSAAVVDPNASGSQSSNTGAIVGGIVGAVAVLGALAGLAVYWRRRQAASEYEALALKSNTDNPYAAQRSYS